MPYLGQKINRPKRLNPDCNICKEPLTDNNWYKGMKEINAYKCKFCHNESVKIKKLKQLEQLVQPISETIVKQSNGYTVQHLKLEPMEIPDWLKSRVRLG